jgi:GNAT superfamily N-acetyltransferase
MTPGEVAVVVERLAYRAWPAQEEAMFDAWILRSSPGLRTRRINSATSPIVGGADLAEAAAHIRAWFEARRSDPIVRILSVSDPAVDGFFAAAGWKREAPTIVMTAHLEAADARRPSRIEPTVQPAWADAKQRFTGMTDTVTATWLRRAGDIRAATAYASVVRDGVVLAIGQGVVDEGWLGLFDLNTDPVHRRQGLADRLVGDLEAWAHDRSVDRAYLQVEEQNEPARRLYEKRGYGEAYSYWYRRLTG